VIKSMRFCFTLLLPVVVLVLVFAKLILLLFGRGYAHEGAMLLRLTAITSFPLAINMICVSVLNIKNRIGMVMLVNFILTGVTIGVSYFVMPMGLEYIGYTWLTIQCLVALPASLYLLKVVRNA